MQGAAGAAWGDVVKVVRQVGSCRGAVCCWCAGGGLQVGEEREQ